MQVKAFSPRVTTRAGDWKPQKGFSGRAAFGSGELWQLYDRTKDERFRRWAELWNAHLLGKEASENHDTGFLNFYSSVLAYRATKDARSIVTAECGRLRA